MTILPGENQAPLRPDDPRQVGPYRLVSRLGRGGMGTVYLGTGADGRKVAVKVINRDLADEPTFRERFRREVTAARQVRRFCTAPVLDAELDTEPLYVVTEFIEGPNLEQAVAERGPLPGSDLEGLAVGVATALSAIHAAGIVHRDLKPANVLLSATGPRVIDFGIARALDAVDGPTRTGQIVGTPSYMPPELLHGEPVTPASDIFAWGCVVAYAGTGRPPFAGNTMPEIFYKIAHEQPVLDGLDPALRDLVTVALDKDPARRPTAQDLLGRLLGTTRPDVAEAAETVRNTWPHDYPARTRVYEPGAGQPPAPTVARQPAAPTTVQPPPRPTASGGRGRKRTVLFAGIGAGAVAIVAAVAVTWALLSGNSPLKDGPPAKGAVLFSKDNFDNFGSGWDNGNLSCGRYQDSGYRLAVSGLGSSTFCRTPKQTTSPTNRYLFEVKVKLERGPRNNQWDAGLYFLSSGSDQYDLVLRPDATVHLRLVNDRKGTDIKVGKVGDFDKTGPNLLQATMDLTDRAGPRFTAWVNGDKVLEHFDTATPRTDGETGLIINRPYNPQEEVDASALFDDYGIWEYAE